MKYSLSQTVERFEKGEQLKFVFFWGNTSKGDEIGKVCFSQWYESPFIINGEEYKTTEHWMMTCKAELFSDLEIREKIILSSKPGEVKDLGRQILIVLLFQNSSSATADNEPYSKCVSAQKKNKVSLCIKCKTTMAAVLELLISLHSTN